eukprot:g39912.t1
MLEARVYRCETGNAQQIRQHPRGRKVNVLGRNLTFLLLGCCLTCCAFSALHLLLNGFLIDNDESSSDEDKETGTEVGNNQCEEMKGIEEGQQDDDDSSSDDDKEISTQAENEQCKEVHRVAEVQQNNAESSSDDDTETSSEFENKRHEEEQRDAEDQQDNESSSDDEKEISTEADNKQCKEVLVIAKGQKDNAEDESDKQAEKDNDLKDSGDSQKVEADQDEEENVEFSYPDTTIDLSHLQSK